MGFLSVLGNIAKTAVGFVPGVGPIASAAINAGIDVAGGAVGARASGKASKQQQEAVQRGITGIRAGASRAQDIGRDYLKGIDERNAPYATAGAQSTSQLSKLTGDGGEFEAYRPKQFEGTMDTFKFDPSQVEMDPGFARRLDESRKAILASRAATGSLRGGATDVAIDRKAQDLTSDEYANAYGRAYQGQTAAYQSGVNKFQDTKDTFEKNQAAIAQNQTDRYNRLMGITGVGQHATDAVNSANTTFGTNSQNIETNAANNIAELQTQGGNAAAAGTVGTANAVTGALANIGDRMTMAQMNKNLKPSILSKYKSLPKASAGSFSN